MDVDMRRIAEAHADHMVGKYAIHLPKHRRLRLWKQHHDAVIESLLAYQRLTRARRRRALSLISEN